jgi:hypothetical protein
MYTVDSSSGRGQGSLQGVAALTKSAGLAMARRASAGPLLDDWTAPRMLSGQSRAPVKTVPSAMHERLRSLRGVMRGVMC